MSEVARLFLNPKAKKEEARTKALRGKSGKKGLSAYEIWLSLGNKGTEQDFIRSLQGKDSKSVDTKVIKEIIKEKVIQPKDGLDGKSLYQIWLDAGNTGSETKFLKTMKGEKGDTEYVRTGSVGAGLPLGGVDNDILVRLENGIAGASQWKSSEALELTSTNDYTNNFLLMGG